MQALHRERRAYWGTQIYYVFTTSSFESGVDMAGRKKRARVRYIEWLEDPSGCPVDYLSSAGQSYIANATAGLAEDRLLVGGRSDTWTARAYLGFGGNRRLRSFWPVTKSKYFHVKDMTDQQLTKAIETLQVEVVKAKLMHRPPRGNPQLDGCEDERYLLHIYKPEKAYPVYSTLCREVKYRADQRERRTARDLCHGKEVEGYPKPLSSVLVDSGRQPYATRAKSGVGAPSHLRGGQA